MKIYRKVAVFAAAVLVATGLGAAVSLTASSAAAGPNLFVNPSMETANSAGTAPVSWATDRWGTNSATFSYATVGATGTRSVTTVVPTYKSGDAKWVPAQVAVAPGSYTYSDSYKSGVSTDVVAQYVATNQKVTYAFLGTAPAAASAWTRVSFVFTVPSGTKQMTVLHVLNKVGSLSLDDVSLQSGTEPSPTPTPTPTATATPTPTATATPTPSSTSNPELVPQPGAEAGSGSPTGWDQDSWGSNSPSFVWSTSAHSGSRALQVTVSGWRDGDAKWVYPSQPVTAGAYYTYSDWYKSTAPTAVWLELTSANGSSDYVNVGPGVPAAASYTQYQTGAVIPSGVVSARFMHVLPGNGSLTFDDVSMKQTPFPPGFTRGIVSVTFDDGIQSAYNNGLPILKKYGIPSTQNIVSGFIGGPGYVTSAQVQDYVRSGQEVGSHTVDHSNLTTLTPAQVTSELTTSKTTLTNIVGPAGQPTVTTLAYPYGAWNPTVQAQVQQQYSSARPTDVGFNTKGSVNPYQIKVQNITSDTTPAQVQGWIDYTVAHKYWLVLVYHSVDPPGSPVFGGEGNVYTTTPADLDSEMAAVRASGLVPETTDNALAEVGSQ